MMKVFVKQTTINDIAFDLENDEARISFINLISYGECKLLVKLLGIYEIRVTPLTKRSERLVGNDSHIEKFPTIKEAHNRIEEIMNEEIPDKEGIVPLFKNYERE